MTLQLPAGYRTDPSVVRPGTSAALTARTIDATVKSPLGRAQDAVATIIPTMAERAPSPVLIGTLGVTLALALVVSRRMRFRPSAVLAGGLMLLPLSSHQPPPGAAEFRHDGQGFVTPAQYAAKFSDPSLPPPRNERVAVPTVPAAPVAIEPVPPAYQSPTYAIDYAQPRPASPEMRHRRLPPIELVIPAEELELLTQRARELRDDGLRMAFRLYAERQQIRRHIARMRLRQQFYELQRSADRGGDSDDDGGGR